MKRIKSLISLLLTLTMLMSIAPISFAEDAASINIETTASYYNIEKSMSFYASIPAGYTDVRVYADGTQVDADIDELTDNRYKITIPADSFAKYPYAQIKIEADYSDETKSAERTINTYLPTSTKYTKNLTMSEWTEDMGDSWVKSDGDEVTAIYKAVGFSDNKNIVTATLVRKTGLSGKAADDVSFAIAGPRDADDNSNAHAQLDPEEAHTPVILDAEFNLYRLGNESFTLRIPSGIDGESAQVVSGLSLTSGVWNKVSVQLDFEKQMLVYQVDDGTKITSGSQNLSITAVKYLRFWLNPATSSSAEESFIAIDDISVNSYDGIAKRFELTSPAKGDGITSEFTATAYAIDAEKVYLYVDGVKSAEQTGIAGEQNYSFTINPASVGYGDKEIRVVALYADGTMDSGSAVVCVKEVEELTINSSKTSELINFNEFPKDWSDGVADQTMQNNMTSKFSWYVNGSANAKYRAKVSKVDGRSDAPDDYAVEVVKSSGEKHDNASKDPYLNFLYSSPAPSVDISNKTFNMEFDMKINTNTDIIRLVCPALWKTTKVSANSLSISNVFINKGELYGTDYTVVPGKWVHYSLKLADGKWTVKVHEYDTDGKPVNEQVVVNDKASTSTTVGNVRFGIIQLTDKSEGEVHAGFALDNAKVWLEDSGTQIESITYDDAQAVSNHTIPYTAETLTLNLDSEVASDALTAELYVNDEKVNGADITIGSAAVTVTLPELEANSKIRIDLKDTEGTWADVSTFAYVSNENGLYTGCLEYFEDDGQFIAHTIAASNTRLKGIVASYADNSMTDVNVSDIYASAGDSCTMLSAPYSVKTKVMIWDSMDTIKPVMKAYTLGE